MVSDLKLSVVFSCSLPSPQPVAEAATHVACTQDTVSNVCGCQRNRAQVLGRIGRGY